MASKNTSPITSMRNFKKSEQAVTRIEIKFYEIIKYNEAL